MSGVSSIPESSEPYLPHCSEFGGFEVNMFESTIALDTDWRPIQDGTAIAAMAEPTVRTVRAEGSTWCPLQPPPQYVLALAWSPAVTAPLAVVTGDPGRGLRRRDPGFTRRGRVDCGCGGLWCRRGCGRWWCRRGAG